MIFDIKMIIAAIITAGLAGTFLITNVTVGNLVGDFGGKIDIWPKAQQEQDTMDFTLFVENYNKMSFSGDDLRVEINGVTKGNVGGGDFDVDKIIMLSGFRGKGTISDVMELNGSVKKFQLSGASIKFSDKPYNSESKFSSALIDNLFFAKLQLDNVTGTLTKEGSKITFSSADVTLENVRGKFSFDGGLKIEGLVKSITIPSYGIKII